MRQALVLGFFLVAGCGGGGGGGSNSPPPPNTTTVTIRYLRATPAYDGWGLHLWGNAISAATSTTWNSPRAFDSVQGGAAVFNVPVIAPAQPLNFILHNGDLKSPLQDLSIVPSTFGAQVWVVQDAAIFANEADARAALALLGNASASVDFSPVTPAPTDSGLAADWASHANFIEIYVRGFQDSNADGIGDLQGVISRLDWLRDQGYTGIWLMPVFRSADRDHGYAVADYRAIEPDYGTTADFDQLVTQAHSRGLAVILDYMMNHAASTHPIFLDATTGAANPKRDWFVWSNSHPAGWNTFSGDPWRNNGNGWYYGVFGALMPDWNLRNPSVVAWHENNLRYWLNRGVDGFRFDAVGVLYEDGAATWENAPDNHPLLAQARSLIEAYGKRYTVCEGPSAPAAYAAASSCGRAFAFQAVGPLYSSVSGGQVDSALVAFLSDPLADRMPLILGNHDGFAGDRVWTRLGGDVAAYRLLSATYLLTSRTPFAYYGEDIGMANGGGLTGDAALRAPMSWTADATNAGFSMVTPFRALSANSTTHNVAVEQSDSASLLRHYRELLNLRKTYPVLADGTRSVQSAANDPVLRLSREDADECAAVLVNFSSASQVASVNTTCAGRSFTAIFGTMGTVAANGSGQLSLNVPPRVALVYQAIR